MSLMNPKPVVHDQIRMEFKGQRETRKGRSKSTAMPALCFLPTLRIPRRRWTKDGFKRYQIGRSDTTTEARCAHDLVQRGTLLPAHGEASVSNSVSSQPKIADGDKPITRIQ